MSGGVNLRSFVPRPLEGVARAELEMEAVRQQEKEASRRWISSFATSILTAIAVALVLPLFTKGR